MVKSKPSNRRQLEPFFATCPKGLEELLRDELMVLGVQKSRLTAAGVSFRANWSTAYGVLLGSRLASRLLHPLAEFEARSPEDLHRHVRRIDWSRHMDSNGTLAVDAHVSGPGITHRQFAAQTVKDGVVDQFRARFGERPSVDRINPDVRLNLRIRNGQATLSLDLSGAALHQRGYRQSGGAAPLKENLAAALLTRCGWPKIAHQGGSFVDPCCGSGTLLIEAALMATNTAPGTLRTHFGVFGWKQFDASLWRRIGNQAIAQQKRAVLQRDQRFIGYDSDPKAVAAARENVRRAGLEELISIARRDLHDFRPSKKPQVKPGLVLCNPPYAERLGSLPSVVQLHARLGAVLQEIFDDWKVGIFSGRPSLVKLTALKANKTYRLFNGPLPCVLFLFDAKKRFGLYRQQPIGFELPGWGTIDIGCGAEHLRQHLQKSAQDRVEKDEAHSPRPSTLYRFDLPDYPVTIAVDTPHVVVKATQPDTPTAESRLNDILLILPSVLKIEPRQITLEWTEDPAFDW